MSKKQAALYVIDECARQGINLTYRDLSIACDLNLSAAWYLINKGRYWSVNKD